MLVHKELFVISLDLNSSHDLVVLHVHADLFVIFRRHYLAVVLLCVGVVVRVLLELLHVAVWVRLAPAVRWSVVLNVHDVVPGSTLSIVGIAHHRLALVLTTVVALVLLQLASHSALIVVIEVERVSVLAWT